MKLKNIAIVAHVDHGKTTLVDELLKQSGVYAAHEHVTERVMDSGELEKERGITIRAKNCAIRWKDTKINLLDTPGHADFGGEVERSLMMVDGIMLLVDASEGPLPQTRFVLSKAVEKGIKVAVFINKVDRHDSRIDEVKSEVEDLLLEIASMSHIDNFDLDIPFYYGSGRNGYASLDKDRREGNMHMMLDFFISDYYPSPKVEINGGLQLLVTNLSYSNYLGVLMVGRIQRGTIENAKQALWMGKDGKTKTFKTTSVQIYDGLGVAQVQSASAGEIVIIAGLEEANIGDTICSPESPEALPRIEVEPPTVSVQVSVSTSPLSGREGEYLTSRRLEEFLQDATRKNVSIKYEGTSDPKVFLLKARGELQIAVVFEEIRRQGFELMIARPQVITKMEGEQLLEPFERLVLDVPTEFTGTLTQEMNTRKGKLESMLPFGESRTRLEFTIPSRGLIGYRSSFLTTTKGQGLMSSYFLGYQPHVGKMLGRINGALIADRAGKATPYALWGLLDSGRQYIAPGDEVYEGQVVGEHTRANDLNVNVCREKALNNVRSKNKDENIILPPPPERTLDWALDLIDDNEWVEVTPKNIRIRKKELSANKRSVVR
jgi:GTP-binding protein